MFDTQDYNLDFVNEKVTENEDSKKYREEINQEILERIFDVLNSFSIINEQGFFKIKEMYLLNNELTELIDSLLKGLTVFKKEKVNA